MGMYFLRVGYHWRFTTTIIAVALIILVGLGGCVPRALHQSFYIVNREGHYFAGDRCSPNLSEITVEVANGSESPDVVWHAVASIPVSEFEIFAESQPNVVTEHGVAHQLSGKVKILLISIKGKRDGGEITLSEIENGGLVSWTGAETWAEFWAIPGYQFGCR